MKLVTIVCFFIGFSRLIHGQNIIQKDTSEASLRLPLDIPIYLSGNFAELRSSHFHAGLDIKTQGEIGKNVYAAADGYISRIKIQTLGYGHSLYITHPGGYTTVYAHLSKFSDEIENYVKDYQYRNKTFELDIYLGPSKFRVTKGQKIALSGNTGGSGGPHLHFEIRNTENQHPLNGLLFPFHIADNIAPVIKGIALYPLAPSSSINHKNEKLIINLTKDNRSYKRDFGSVIELGGQIGFAVEVYDYMNGTSNRYGIFSIELFIDSISQYYHEVREFSFDEAGFVNSHVDYEESLKTGRKFQKMFKDQYNPLNFYKKTLPHSGYTFSDDSIHNIQFLIKDVAGNETSYAFKIKSTKDSLFCSDDQPNLEQENGVLFPYNKYNSFENQSFKVNLSKGTLYNDCRFTYSVESDSLNPFSDVFHISNMYIPVQKRFLLSLKAKEVSENLRQKVVFAYINHKNETESVNASYNEGWVTATVKNFGTYYVTIDTIAPVITPLNVYPNANVSDKKSIDFKIKDDFSGITNYDGYIDNQWVLFEYDPKEDFLQYVFDDKRLEKNKKHLLKLRISDEKDNVATYSVEFYY